MGKAERRNPHLPDPTAPATSRVEFVDARVVCACSERRVPERQLSAGFPVVLSGVAGVNVCPQSPVHFVFG
jgi:hypothetical protein